MAELTLKRWVPFVPDIGTNRTLPAEQQVVLEVAASLTREELMLFREQLMTPTLGEGETPDAARIRVVGQHVRLANGPHRLGGRDVTTTAEYADVCLSMADQYNLRELFAAVGYFNSISGGDALFSERRSGGMAFTLHRSAAKEADETGGR